MKINGDAMPEKGGEFITVNQASKIYGVPRSVIYAWLDGGLAHKKMPNGFHSISKAAADDFARRNSIIAPWKVLLADDDKKFLELSAKALEKAGYDCITSENVADAIFKTRKFMPDLLVLDVAFPEKCGFDIAETLKKDAFGDIPILYISGVVGGRKVLGAAGEHNCAGFLEKPFTPPELLGEVNQVFKHFANSRAKQ